MNQQPMGYEKQNTAAQPAQAYKLPDRYQFGLFDCFSPFGTCLLTCCCPCVTFGKITAREDGETDPSGINGNCCVYAILLHFGLACCFQGLNRSRLRKKYHIDGNGCTDCLTTCFCHCCALIQEDKETIVRQTGMNPKTDQPYAPVGGMTYP